MFAVISHTNDENEVFTYRACSMTMTQIPIDQPPNNINFRPHPHVLGSHLSVRISVGQTCLHCTTGTCEHLQICIYSLVLVYVYNTQIDSIMQKNWA